MSSTLTPALQPLFLLTSSRATSRQRHACTPVLSPAFLLHQPSLHPDRPLPPRRTVSRRSSTVDKRPSLSLGPSACQPFARANLGHAPHGPYITTSAGPSRCFCTSSATNKAVSSSFSVQLADNIDTTPYHPSTVYTGSSRYPPTNEPYDEDSSPATTSEAHPETLQSLETDFFTAEPRTTDGRAEGKQRAEAPLPLFSDQLPPHELTAFLDRAHVLIRSGERSLSAVVKTFDARVCSEAELDELQFLVLQDLIARDVGVAIVRDIYRISLAKQDSMYVHPPGRRYENLRRLRMSALERCFRLLFTNGLLQDAALLARDPRLKGAQAKHQVERLLYSLNQPDRRPKAEPSQRGARLRARTQDIGSAECLAKRQDRLALQELSRTMCVLVDDGLHFKTDSMQRAMWLLCRARAYGHLLRLATSVQRRVQIDRDGLMPRMRTAGGFSRLRPEERERPPFLSQKAVENAVRILCQQDSQGARCAYELVKMLPSAQRSQKVYYMLMEHFGEVSIRPEPLPGGDRFEASRLPPKSDSPQLVVTADEEIWREYCRSFDINALDPAVISCRLLSHAAHGSVGLIAEDIEALMAASPSSLMQLTEKSRLASLACLIEHNEAQLGFRLAREMLRRIPEPTDRARTKVFNALLSGAVTIRNLPPREPRDGAEDPSASVAQASSVEPDKARKRLTREARVRRFMVRLKSLHDQYGFRPDLQTVDLMIRVLTQWDRFVDTQKLRKLVEAVHSLDSVAARSEEVPNARTRKVPRSQLSSVSSTARAEGPAPLLQIFVSAFERRSDLEGVGKVADVLHPRTTGKTS